MEGAHRAHGKEFEAAYQRLTSLDPKDPLHRGVVQRIAASRDPGEALMDWYGDSGDESRAGRSAGNFWVPTGWPARCGTDLVYAARRRPWTQLSAWRCSIDCPQSTSVATSPPRAI